ncbi:hypothetical protein D3C81_1614780 [compost metagenome]
MPLQGGQRRGIVRIAQPALQGLAGAFENIHRFFEKNLDDFIVQPGRSALCRSWLASEGLTGTVFFQWKRDFADVHRWQASSYIGTCQIRCGVAQFSDAQGAAAVAANQAHGRWIEAFIEQVAQSPDPLRLRADFLARGQFVEHVDQRLVGPLRLLEKPFADRQAAFFHSAVEVEQGFA